MIKNFIKSLFIIITIFNSNANTANENFFNDGKLLFEKKDFKNARFKFEKDIVFNPKSEKSYLYLAKIFKIDKKNQLVENNLRTVILLNPKNEEAIYELALHNINKSNFDESKVLIKNFKEICIKLCSKKAELENRLENSLKK
jgi:tetratricopeptide (TPR) repeat protein